MGRNKNKISTASTPCTPAGQVLQSFRVGQRPRPLALSARTVARPRRRPARARGAPRAARTLLARPAPPAGPRRAPRAAHAARHLFAAATMWCRPAAPADGRRAARPHSRPPARPWRARWHPSAALPRAMAARPPHHRRATPRTHPLTAAVKMCKKGEKKEEKEDQSRFAALRSGASFLDNGKLKRKSRISGTRGGRWLEEGKRAAAGAAALSPRVPPGGTRFRTKVPKRLFSGKSVQNLGPDSNLLNLRPEPY